MAHLKSVRVRFVTSVFGNGIRAVISFLTNIMIARTLAPKHYGDLTFLLSSFTAIKSLFDAGTSNAFFTFIAQHAAHFRVYFVYYAWLAFQFFALTLFILFIGPHGVLNYIWLGYPRLLIWLAFLASFFQQQLWMVASQIGESLRLSVKVQMLSLGIVSAYFMLILGAMYTLQLSVIDVLSLMSVVYFLGAFLGLFLLRNPHPDVPVARPSFKAVLLEYKRYVSPLVLLSWFSFGYHFIDSWMLQRFGGALQQAYYRIAAQVVAISLLATTAVLKIFWKETAEARHRGDVGRIALLYLRFSRTLFSFAMIVTGFLIPWTREIIHFLLGGSYLAATPVLMLMFFYPVHQTLGQISGSTLLASSRTRAYAWISGISMVFAMLTSYFILAPRVGVLITGLGLGALGLAIKMVGVNVLSVNAQLWVVAKMNGWKYDWFYQVAIIVMCLLLSYIAKSVVILFCHDAALHNPVGIIFAMGCAGLLYAAFMLVFVIFQSRLFTGFSRQELLMVGRSFFIKD